MEAVDDELDAAQRFPTTERVIAHPASSELRVRPAARDGGLGRVVRVLLRHGFASALRGRRGWPTPVQVREAFEELGVVYLKFGQVLALRRDLLPEPYTTELEKLHDQLPPVPYDEVARTIERELGRPIAAMFATFDVSPMAAATIAQVHTATLDKGYQVIVKVRRPAVEQEVARDIPTLARVARLLDSTVPALRPLDLPGMVREFRSSLQRELHFTHEAEAMHRFRRGAAAVPEVWIPAVVPELSTDAVLVEEFSPGERIDRYAAGHPEDRARLARAVAALMLRQVFETGLFHADPHPGNLFVLPDGRLCLHDFGMVGELEPAWRSALARLLAGLVDGDTIAVVDAYIDMGLIGPEVNTRVLAAELAPTLAQIRERPIAEQSLGDALGVLLRASAEHRVRSPGVLLLLSRAFLVTEAVLKQLDPRLSVFEVFQAEIPRLAAARLRPDRLAAGARRFLLDVEAMGVEFPADLRRIMRRLAAGEVGRVELPGVDKLGRRASRDLERLTGGIASGALLVAGSLLATIPGWHRTAGDVLVVFGLLGTLAVGLGAAFRRSV